MFALFFEVVVSLDVIATYIQRGICVLGMIELYDSFHWMKASGVERADGGGGGGYFSTLRLCVPLFAKERV